MNNYIQKYQEIMANSGKNLETIIAERIKDNVFGLKRYILLSETNDEWIIHPIYIQENGQLETGDGSYKFKRLHSYKNIKDLFNSRLEQENKIYVNRSDCF